MEFALTTRWNAGRHVRGEDMVEEILDLGFHRLELGYDTRLDLVDGVRRMVAEKAVVVDSLHNFCPLPVAAVSGHPEIFTLASKDVRVREQAVHHTSNTIRFAAEIGAKVVVTHAGNVEMHSFTRDLIELHERGQQFSLAYEKLKMKLQLQREKKARKQLGYLREGLSRLLPLLEECRVRLAIENLPTWEAFPTELELHGLLSEFQSPWLAYWHDVGHGKIRENLGFINQQRWLEKLSPNLAGMHVHDVKNPAQDHVMPPHGDIDFSTLLPFAKMEILRVIEPTTRTPREAIEEAHRFLQRTWDDPESGQAADAT